MVRPKMTSTSVRNVEARKVGYNKRLVGLIKKINELTILCDLTACLIFVCREDNVFRVWPNENVAKCLINRFLSLSDLKRTMKSDDQESFIRTNTVKIEKKLADCRRVSDDMEMDFLMVELHHGHKLEDLSESQIEKLKTYADRKIKGYSRELTYKGYTYTGINDYKPYQLVNEPIKGLAVAYDSGVNGFRLMGSERDYVFDGPRVEQQPWDHEIRAAATSPPLSQDNESYDDSDDDMEASDDSDDSSSSSSGGAGNE